MADETIPTMLVGRLIKERIDIVIMAAMLGFFCWFNFTLVGNVLSMTEKMAIVIERNTQVIEAHKRETLERMATDNTRIIDLLNDIKAKQGK